MILANRMEIKMSEIEVYMIAHLTVHDAEQYRKYEKGARHTK